MPAAVAFEQILTCCSLGPSSSAVIAALTVVLHMVIDVMWNNRTERRGFAFSKIWLFIFLIFPYVVSYRLRFERLAGLCGTLRPTLAKGLTHMNWQSSTYMFLVQERHGDIRGDPQEGHKNDLRSGAPLL